MSEEENVEADTEADSLPTQEENIQPPTVEADGEADGEAPTPAPTPAPTAAAVVDTLKSPPKLQKVREEEDREESSPKEESEYRPENDDPSTVEEVVAAGSAVYESVSYYVGVGAMSSIATSAIALPGIAGGVASVGGATAGMTGAASTGGAWGAGGGAWGQGCSGATSAGGSMGALMLYQLQFLATTGLIDAKQSSDVKDFQSSLDWVNIWWDASSIVPASLCAATDDSGVGGTVFIGNTILVFGILLCLLLVHVVTNAWIQSRWVAQDAANLKKWRRSRGSMRQGQLRDQMKSQRGERKLEGLMASPGKGEETMHEEVAAPIDGSSCTPPPLPPRSTSLIKAPDGSYYFNPEKDSAKLHVRKRSSSIWTHYPHIELLFLLFAFEGATTSQASALGSSCGTLRVIGFILLLVFPVLMIVCTAKTLYTWIHGTKDLVYTPYPPRQGSCWRRLCDALKGGWGSGNSMLSWFDKGHWEARPREGKLGVNVASFRVGFEPLFKDFTQGGAFYMVLLLMRFLALGLVAALVKNGQLASVIFLAVYAVNFAVVVKLRPFCNSAVNVLEAGLLAVDTLTLGIMTLSSAGVDSPALQTAFIWLQLLALFCFTIPVYADLFIVVGYHVLKKCGKVCRSSLANDEEAGGVKASKIKPEDAKKYFPEMLRANLKLCGSSVKRGVLAAQ
ncbi:unnamed protein product [Chrysoparadoxa australica]